MAALDDTDDSELSDTQSVKNLNERSESETDESENNEQQTEGSNFFVRKVKSTKWSKSPPARAKTRPQNIIT